MLVLEVATPDYPDVTDIPVYVSAADAIETVKLLQSGYVNHHVRKQCAKAFPGGYVLVGAKLLDDSFDSEGQLFWEFEKPVRFLN